MWWNTPECLRGDVLLVATTVATAVLIWIRHRNVLHPKARHDAPRSLHALAIDAAVPPLLFAAWYYCAYFLTPLALHLFRPDWEGPVRGFHPYLWHGGALIGLFWFLYRSAEPLEKLLRAARPSPGRFDDFFFPLLTLALKTLIPIFGLAVLLGLLHFPHQFASGIRRAWEIVLIIGVALIIQRAILLLEKVLLTGLDPKIDNFSARGVQTRVQILRKFAVVFNALIALAAVLMLFEGVRDFGKSILASAGVLGIILSISAQRSLGALFAGLQLALAQPIRIGDWVIVEGESGTIEEIRLSYIVIRIWDLRRLVVPITYFLEKPFQNWTLASTSLIGVVKIRVDFSLPVDVVREEIRRWVGVSPLWDGKTFAVQVTDSDASSMELRVIASAANSSATFDLQCMIRERLFAYLTEKYPQSLTKVRQMTMPLPES